MMSRNFTNKINWIFDNLIPPFIRDNKFFMSIWFRIVFGNKSSYFMEFKENAHYLTKDEFAHYYKFLADKHIKRETDLSHLSVAKILSNIVGESVLDVGCGRGFLVHKIAKKYDINVVGIDMSIPAHLVNTKTISFLSGDIEKLPFIDNFFDTVVCSHTLEHVQNIDLAIAELRRVARKRLIVMVPRQREYKYTFDLHIHFFPYEFSLKRLFKNEHAEYITIENELFYMESTL